jgi:hypothetical protein
MAIDQKEVALSACTKIVFATSQLLNSLDSIEAIGEQLTAAGIDLASFEADINAGSGIKHCDPATYKNILIFRAGIISAMQALYDGTPTQQCWAGLQKARL